MKRRIRTAEEQVYFKRWSNVVHILKDCPIPTFDVTRTGHVLFSFPVVAVCGQKAKMHREGSNRFVESHPTCVRCIGAET